MRIDSEHGMCAASAQSTGASEAGREREKERE
jgi:hypothetical protein